MFRAFLSVYRVSEDFLSPWPQNERQFVSFEILLSTLRYFTYIGLWYAHKGQPLLGLNGAQMGLCSFFSDFVVASPESFSFGVRKRAFALDLLSIYFYCGALLVNVVIYASKERAWPLLGALLLAKITVLDWSAQSASRYVTFETTINDKVLPVL